MSALTSSSRLQFAGSFDLLLTGCRRNRNFPVGHEALGIHMDLYKTPCKNGLVSSPQCVGLGTVAAVCRDGSSSLLWTG